MKKHPEHSHMNPDRRYFIKQLGSLALFTAIPGVVSASDPGRRLAMNAKTEETKETANALEKVVRSDAEWQKLLTPEQYYVTRKKGTEKPFTGEYNHFKGKGVFACVGCGLSLFSSETKFDSGTGWPSFWAPIAAHHIREESDHSFFMKRTEVLCNRCDAHLGHVFRGWPPTYGTSVLY